MGIMERERLRDPGSVQREMSRKPPGVRKHGLVGDTVVRRLKGDAGLVPRHYRVFRSLALYELGDVSYGDMDDAVFEGQVLKVAFWLECIPLTSPARDKLLARGLSPVYEDGTMNPAHDYVNLGNPGRLLTFSNGEYVRCERGEGFFAVSWSSAMPLRPAIEALIEGVGGKYEISDGSVVERDNWVEGSSLDVMKRIKEHFGEITFARFNGDRLALAWRSDTGVDDDRKIRLHECFVVASVDDRDMLAELLKMTATPGVGATASKVVWQLSDLFDGFPHA